MRRMILRYQSGSKVGQVEVYPISRYQALYFGRDPACDVRFHPTEDVMVSRNHAVIEWTEEEPIRFIISDMLSSNGTYLNGVRIHDTVSMKSGDRVQLGANGPIIDVVVDELKDVENQSDNSEAIRRTSQIPAVKLEVENTVATMAAWRKRNN